MAIREHEADIVNNPDASRWEMSIGEELIGFLDYLLAGDRIVLTYVEIRPSLGGRGLGAQLTKAALDECRGRGLKVVPECPFIVRYIREHPEYADLL